MLCRGWAWLILRFRNPLTVIWRMGCRERAEEGDKLEGIWPLPDTRCHQGWIHELATCAVTQGPALQRRFGLMLCFCYLEILSFVFELVFCESGSMGQRSMCMSRGDVHNM